MREVHYRVESVEIGVVTSRDVSWRYHVGALRATCYQFGVQMLGHRFARREREICREEAVSL